MSEKEDIKEEEKQNSQQNVEAEPDMNQSKP